MASSRPAQRQPNGRRVRPPRIPDESASACAFSHHPPASSFGRAGEEEERGEEAVCILPPSPPPTRTRLFEACAYIPSRHSTYR